MMQKILQSLLMGEITRRGTTALSSMARYRSPADGRALTSIELLRTDKVGTWIQAPQDERRFLRYAPEFIDEPAEPRGFPYIGPAVYKSPPVFVTAVNAACLVGYRTVVAGGFFHDDEILLSPAAVAEYLDKLDQDDTFLNEQTGLRRSAQGAPDFTLHAQGRSVRYLPGTTAVLCSHEPSNFGSLLFRVLPKLRTLADAGVPEVPVLAWAWPESFRRLFYLFGIPESRLIQHDMNTITCLERALLPSLRNPNAFLDHESHALMQSISDRYRGRQRGRRLYISRLRHGQSSNSTRVLQNEAALIAALPKLNFEIIEPERLTPEQQIATFESADMIVGPAGSAMFNVMFCRPGTKIIDIESEPNWIYAHSGLFASCHTRYGLVIGCVDPSDERPVHRRWSVDLDALLDRITSFIHA